jgi:hypothetical protein
MIEFFVALIYAGTRSAMVADRKLNQRIIVMNKLWTKPSMCQVEAGFEISRYLPAELKK